MTRSVRELALEDRILWSKVAKSATPLPGKAPVEDAARMAAEADKTLDRELKPTDGTNHTPIAPVTRRPAHALHPIDRTTRRKIAKGRIAIEARIDLHGLTQAEAHGFLLDFLRRAHAEGIRYVLVITGKGSSLGSVGILRKAVPEWLATPTFGAFVSGYEDAARGHGGGGALYIRLRQRPRKKGGADDPIR